MVLDYFSSVNPSLLWILVLWSFSFVTYRLSAAETDLNWCSSLASGSLMVGPTDGYTHPMSVACLFSGTAMLSCYLVGLDTYFSTGPLNDIINLVSWSKWWEMCGKKNLNTTCSEGNWIMNWLNHWEFLWNELTWIEFRLAHKVYLC